MKASLLLLTLGFALVTQNTESQETPTPPGKAKTYSDLVKALQMGKVEEVLKMTEGSEDPGFIQARSNILQNRGAQRFFDADIKGSLEDFDEFVKLNPERDPYHWQRGITYYYADQFKAGKEQFERHQTVNSQDVENAVWHFLCAVRAPGGSVESAQEKLIPISKDTRVPMKEVHALFGGKGTPEAVLKAAQDSGDPAKSDRARNAFLYAHLYLGIYYEAIGKDDLMKTHIAKAAGEYHVDHYMGNVAKVHAKLRGITPTESGLSDSPKS